MVWLLKMLYNDDQIVTQKNTIEYWQQLFFASVVGFIVIGGFPLIVVGIFAYYKTGLMIYGMIQGLLYVITAVILKQKKLKTEFREVITVAASYCIGIFLIITTGSKGAGTIYLFFAFVICGFLLNVTTIKSFMTINLIIFSSISVLYFKSALDIFAIVDYGETWLINALSIQVVGFFLLFLIHGTVDSIQKQIKTSVENENDMMTILNAMTDGVVVVDLDLRVIRMNPFAREKFCLVEEGYEGKFIHEIFQTVDTMTQDQVNDIFSNLKSDPQGKLNVILIKSSYKYMVSMKLAPIMDEKNGLKGYVCIIHDLTESQKEELNLRHAQKMEAIGTMAGGVAHDFNNMLGGILGYAELSERLIEDTDSNLYRFNSEIIKTSLKAADLTKQLLTYARKKDMHCEVVDLNQCVVDVVTLMERTFEKRVEIEWTPCQQNLMVFGDLALLENAILNLGLNSKDAMRSGGVISVSLGKVYLNEGYCNSSQFELIPGTYGHIRVKDQGIGMNQKVQDRIFEPFFTTKDIGKGTGLGLSATYGTIVAHKGAIIVKSIVGVGTAIDLYLPIHVPDPLAVLPRIEVAQARDLHKQGTLLLIDDEDIIRKVLKELLETIGYKVMEVSSGEEGLELLRSLAEPIQGVLLDMIMPKMNGKEVFKRIRIMKPELKVIMISGFIDENHIEDLFNLGITSFIKKPFTIESIKEGLSVL